MKMRETGVAVWRFDSQEFIPFIPCPGEKRVRVDVHDELCNYAVFSVKYTGDQSFDVLLDLPLRDWVLSLS